MFIHSFCLCPLGLTIKLNYNISKALIPRHLLPSSLSPSTFNLWSLTFDFPTRLLPRRRLAINCPAILSLFQQNNKQTNKKRETLKNKTNKQKTKIRLKCPLHLNSPSFSRKVNTCIIKDWKYTLV